MRGFFITFEGIEGSGKSSQIKTLLKTLKARKKRALLTQEPGGTTIGRQIRKLLLSAKNDKLQPMTDLFLYNAARYQHLHDVILPALKKGMIVLCDRYADATIAYQAHAQGLPLASVERLNALATSRLQPHLTFLLDLSPQVGLARAKLRTSKYKTSDKEDRFERKGLAFQKKVRQGYLALAKKFPRRFVILDATKTRGEIAEKIWKTLEKRLVEKSI